jgi:hypothetical protein
VTIDGYTFDSQAEAARFRVLRMMLNAGQISELTLQKSFPCVVHGVKVCTYVADFAYRNAAGEFVVEDVKSAPTKTPIYRLKKKLVKALYGIEIVEITK